MRGCQRLLRCDSIRPCLIVSFFLLFLLMQTAVDAQTMNRLPSGARVRLYKADEGKANGRCVLLCPGGAYSYLSHVSEGTDWVPWFTERGYSVGVLYYRMPEHQPERLLTDATEAVSFLREHADELHLTYGCVGVMGFSSGGHDAALLATQAPPDLRPDFQILFYPVISMLQPYTHKQTHDNLLGPDATAELERAYSNELHVTWDTPPAYIAHATDDDVVPIESSRLYYQSLILHEVPSVLREFQAGGHGFSFSADFVYHDQMLDELDSWLHDLDDILFTTVRSPQASARTSAPRAIFTLDGRRLHTSFSSLPPGLYIVDGKKVRR